MAGVNGGFPQWRKNCIIVELIPRFAQLEKELYQCELLSKCNN